MVVEVVMMKVQTTLQLAFEAREGQSGWPYHPQLVFVHEEGGDGGGGRR